MVTLFLGSCISDVNLGSSGWAILIGWTSWIILLPILVELAKFVIDTWLDDDYDENFVS